MMNPIAGSLEELDIEGFQIVRASMFAHLPRKGDPTCTIWPTKISFNRLALQLLNNCEFIRIEVNPTAKKLLVVPVVSSDKDSIRWIKGQKEFSVRNMESRAFGEELYRSWELDSGYNYRATGKLVSSKNKVLLLFDFSNPEMWMTKKDPNA